VANVAPYARTPLHEGRTVATITGASHFPVGPPNTAQHNRSAASTSGPYTGGRDRRTARTSVGFNVAPRA